MDTAKNKSDTIPALKQLVRKWMGDWYQSFIIAIEVSLTHETRSVTWKNPRLTYPSGKSEKAKGKWAGQAAAEGNSVADRGNRMCESLGARRNLAHPGNRERLMQPK